MKVIFFQKCVQWTRKYFLFDGSESQWQTALYSKIQMIQSSEI